MLYRSLYFVFNDEQPVRQLIHDLEQRFDLDDSQLHAIIEKDHELSELPGATLHKKSASAIRQEMLFLYASVGVFTISLIGMILALLTGSWYLVALFAFLVVVGQLSGYLLGNRIPNAQIDRFRTGLAQGDILLQVDAPLRSIKTIKAFIAERFPQSTTGVSNWHVGTLGI